MLPAAVHEDSKAALNRRLESIGWGLFLIVVGALWLIPAERVPEGIWLIVIGLILFGVNAARYLNAIKLSAATILLGFLAVVLGIGKLVGVDVPFFPILVILFGVGIILRPWIDPLLERKQT
jgi:hypothetical protein